jgi:hypothetical protein
MKKEKKSVTEMSIIQMPISKPKNEVFAYVRSERELTDAACKYADKLREHNVEVFERKGNVLATDKGYFAVLFESEIREQPGGIDNPTPFKGSDGRMKIEIKKENGETSVEDLAELVAMKFVPNLKMRKRVWFKDNNPENCNADNLIYAPEWKYWFLKIFKTKR